MEKMNEATSSSQVDSMTNYLANTPQVQAAAATGNPADVTRAARDLLAQQRKKLLAAVQKAVKESQAGNNAVTGSQGFMGDAGKTSVTLPK